VASEQGNYLPCVGILKGAGIFLFYEVKAKIPSRGRAKFESTNLCVTKPPPLPLDSAKDPSKLDRSFATLVVNRLGQFS